MLLLTEQATPAFANSLSVIAEMHGICKDSRRRGSNVLPVSVIVFRSPEQARPALADSVALFVIMDGIAPKAWR